MPERYPSDASLLAITEDATSGVEYIPTGQSPYFLEFRKLIQRLLLVANRANDLRVYQDGDLTIGIRPGRCLINNSVIDYPGAVSIGVASNTTSYLWLDSTGLLQVGVSGLPTDRTAFAPLAEIISGTSSITAITDLRGEAFLHIPSLMSIGINTTAGEINQALDGIDSTVDAAALNRLTNGPESTADSEHRHLQVFQDQDNEVFFTLINDHSGVNANVSLVWSLPNRLPDDTALFPDLSNGFLRQRYQNTVHSLVGSVHACFIHEGDLTSTQTDKLIGVVPIDGAVSNVILSMATNIVSDTSADGVNVVAKVNGVGLTTTNPQISDADGSGFRSTAQGDGTPAAMKSDGTEDVKRGDILTVDITRSVTGNVTVEASNIAVLIVIRAAQPE